MPINSTKILKSLTRHLNSIGLRALSETATIGPPINGQHTRATIVYVKIRGQHIIIHYRRPYIQADLSIDGIIPISRQFHLTDPDAFNKIAKLCQEMLAPGNEQLNNT